MRRHKMMYSDALRILLNARRHLSIERSEEVRGRLYIPNNLRSRVYAESHRILSASIGELRQILKKRDKACT